MVVRDKMGHAIGFYAQDPTPTGTDPYTMRIFENKWPSPLLSQFPWQYLQLLKMDLRR